MIERTQVVLNATEIKEAIAEKYHIDISEIELMYDKNVRGTSIVAIFNKPTENRLQGLCIDCKRNDSCAHASRHLNMLECDDYVSSKVSVVSFDSELSEPSCDVCINFDPVDSCCYCYAPSCITYGMQMPKGARQKACRFFTPLQ